mmetsp:Transcript_103884/g.334812  ORF Transcript_103884/g.334812 Transcript_103884/m.334812 type:complete len:536 (-) Transcript_103884:613-2220(-)|eukprot:CAMPEP_0204116474 /NCGR_PEP_ID=MMETSP0361-20130328/5427_1 /ASSEMBLY_ACC=CAM_ASM_000343 /TAXON_ID=268821 /ORGANISM="Scrippsiella Hangoei, Strain SHTV-5" /LENGTH=535 /DNA_ID=CAMNT_0051067273 /DNA_START=47 /DNA_END=1654 /DNA_ORIENTATION=+
MQLVLSAAAPSVRPSAAGQVQLQLLGQRPAAIGGISSIGGSITGTPSWCPSATAAALVAAAARGSASRRNSARTHRPVALPRGQRAKAARRAVTTAWLPGQQDDRAYSSEELYIAYLESISKLPAGFRIGTANLRFVPPEAPKLGELPMRLTVIAADEPSATYAAVFTQNAFPGAPILVGRERLKVGAPLQAFAINNKVSNVFPADGGVKSSEAVCSATASELGLPGGAASVLPSSTGVIGWQLPAKELAAAVPAAVANMQGDSALPAAKAIMTTDRYPKVSSVEFPGGGRLVGFAKGAGMIEPNMATMLCYLLTDVDLDCGKAELQAMLAAAVACSFNSCSVDGDESTSDTVALLSSCRSPKVASDVFACALKDVCMDLAGQVVRNGEGTRHVIRVAVTGASDDATARRVGKGVVNGPLFKSAVSGNDPNVGRLVGKVGQVLSAAGASMTQGCECLIGGETIFKDGRFALDGEKEDRLSDHFKYSEMPSESKFPHHSRCVDIEVRLGGGGSGSAVVLGSDLTREYVDINSDYRS